MFDFGRFEISFRLFFCSSTFNELCGRKMKSPLHGIHHYHHHHLPRSEWNWTLCILYSTNFTIYLLQIKSFLLIYAIFNLFGHFAILTFSCVESYFGYDGKLQLHFPVSQTTCLSKKKIATPKSLGEEQIERFARNPPFLF